MSLSEIPQENGEYTDAINEYFKDEEILKKEIISKNTSNWDYKNWEHQEEVTMDELQIVENEPEKFIFYYDKWNIKEKWTFLNWKKQWTWTSYYENWNIKEKWTFINGEKEWIWISYNENWVVTNTQEYKNWHKAFDWIVLQEDWIYDIPGISKNAKNISCKQFPKIKFWNCRLTQRLWTVIYSVWWEEHKETYYSQRVLPWKWLNIPWRHIAEPDKTIRDWDWYIVIAANYIPVWSTIMTTLGPWKVYDTWWMTGKWIDIYTDWW